MNLTIVVSVTRDSLSLKIRKREVNVMQMFQLLFPNIRFESDDSENMYGSTSTSKTPCLISSEDVYMMSGKILGVSSEEVVETIQRVYAQIKSWYYTIPASQTKWKVEIIR